MNTIAKRSLTLMVVAVFFMSCVASQANAASPWVKETTYGEKTKGKLVYGLKNSLLGWMTPWAEARSPKYKKQWEGFSAGIGGMLLNTAAGLVQLATFYIPVDFPDVGYGLAIPDPNRKVVMFQKSSKHSAKAVSSEPVPAAAPAAAA